MTDNDLIRRGDVLKIVARDRVPTDRTGSSFRVPSTQEKLDAIKALPAVTVGVRPPFYFDRYISGVRMAEDVCVERETTLEGAMLVAARIASKGPNGEAPVLVYRAPVAQTAPDAAVKRVVDLLDDLTERQWVLDGLTVSEIKEITDAIGAVREVQSHKSE